MMYHVALDCGVARVSKDGVRWSEPVRTPRIGDRSTIFYNPFIRRWCYSIRSFKDGYGRSRTYAEHEDFLEGARTLPNRREWVKNAAGGREAAGELVTKRLVFTKGDRLWLNVDARQGSVSVAASDADGAELGSRTVTKTDSTRLEAFPLPAGRAFTLRIRVSDGAKLYSFWTSDAKGRSGGYLAGGSPESATLRDEDTP